MDKRLVLLYAAIGILLFVQAFTHPLVDYPVELMDDFFISEGLTPYIDFFEHHPLFQNFILSPVFWIGTATQSIIALHLLGLAGVAVCAWLVYRIARKNDFKHPHAATLFFLVGYTGLILPFLRYEFWSMLFLLSFFAFSHPFARGLALALLGATSPIVIFATAAMGAVYYVTTFFKNKKDALIAFCGSMTGMLVWLVLHWKIPFSAIYYAIFTFNNKVAHLYIAPWQEMVFFSAFFVLPAVILAIVKMTELARKKNELAVLGLLFTTIFVVQVLMMNLVYGFFSRMKLPAPVPILALAIIFLAAYPKKITYVLVAAQLLLTLFVFTPSVELPELDNARMAGVLDRCVAPDARIVFDETPTTQMHIPLFRHPASHHWFLYYYYEAANATRSYPAFNDPIVLCGNELERNSWICSESTLFETQQSCSQLLVPNSLWIETRTALTGRAIKTR